MKKITITRRQAIDDIKALFGLTKEFDGAGSGYREKVDDTADFYIFKGDVTRLEVINKLQAYFYDKVIADGQCRIDSITLVFTTFHIEARKNQEG